VDLPDDTPGSGTTGAPEPGTSSSSEDIVDLPDDNPGSGTTGAPEPGTSDSSEDTVDLPDDTTVVTTGAPPIMTSGGLDSETIVILPDDTTAPATDGLDTTTDKPADDIPDSTEAATTQAASDEPSTAATTAKPTELPDDTTPMPIDDSLDATSQQPASEETTTEPTTSEVVEVSSQTTSAPAVDAMEETTSNEPDDGDKGDIVTPDETTEVPSTTGEAPQGTSEEAEEVTEEETTTAAAVVETTTEEPEATTSPSLPPTTSEASTSEAIPADDGLVISVRIASDDVVQVSTLKKTDTVEALREALKDSPLLLPKTYDLQFEGKTLGSSEPLARFDGKELLMKGPEAIAPTTSPSTTTTAPPPTPSTTSSAPLQTTSTSPSSSSVRPSSTSSKPIQTTSTSSSSSPAAPSTTEAAASGPHVASNSVTITVKIPAGDIMQVGSLNKTDTIADLRQTLQDSPINLPTNYSFVYEGAVLSDSDSLARFDGKLLSLKPLEVKPPATNYLNDDRLFIAVSTSQACAGYTAKENTQSGIITQNQWYCFFQVVDRNRDMALDMHEWAAALLLSADRPGRLFARLARLSTTASSDFSDATVLQISIDEYTIAFTLADANGDYAVSEPEFWEYFGKSPYPDSKDNATSSEQANLGTVDTEKGAEGDPYDDDIAYEVLASDSSPCHTAGTNKNLVSLAEWNCFLQMMDADRDRKITAKEWNSFMGVEGKAVGRIWLTIARTTIEYAFRDPDTAVLTPDELRLAFSYADVNGDYKVSRAEFFGLFGSYPKSVE